ncbi:hypothetical protein A6M23_17440 [Acidithiobacillus thiooxidans]|uniref:Uncharacterized protein n=1 Tax=Acidithiobacillus thiooxidans TaxID=930 RepID=A0A1C2J7Z3_ACITH|nr:hypothetical protein A6M23_17440 [Acidithiobacillus thiooxidans]OCX84344.1 hypothetical protein A6P08_09205 [Acidithiobacillus thiooxidans]
MMTDMPVRSKAIHAGQGHKLGGDAAEGCHAVAQGSRLGAFLGVASHPYGTHPKPTRDAPPIQTAAMIPP